MTANKKCYDVIIVNYNGEDIISDCLDSIYASSVLPKRVIIYDNNSTDRSCELIEEKYSEVLLLKGKKNLGFGRANNEGMKHSESEFIMFVNSDVILDKKCAEVLLGGFSDPSLAILNPLIIKGWDKKSKDIYAFGAEMNTSGFNYGLYDATGPDRNDLNSFSAACCMARSEAIKKNRFEKRFFLYFEEPDISIRMLQRGLKLGRTGKAKCYHLENYSSDVKNRALGTCFRQYYAIQNHWYMLGKYWPTRLLPAALPLNIAHLIYNFLFFLRNKQFSKLDIIYLACKNFYVGRKLDRRQNDSWTKFLPGGQFKKAFQLKKKVYSN